MIFELSFGASVITVKNKTKIYVVFNFPLFFRFTFDLMFNAEYFRDVPEES